MWGCDVFGWGAVVRFWFARAPVEVSVSDWMMLVSVLM